jgi:hypothetical protein
MSFKRNFMLGSALSAALTLAYAHWIERRWQVVREYDVILTELERPFDGYRIAQISDIHIDHWMTRSLLKKAVDHVKDNRPDLIVITGDIITARVAYDIDLIEQLLSALSAPDGVLFVPGNHDYWEPGQIDILRGMLARANIRDLSNDVLTLERDGAWLHIAGIDDVFAREARLDKVLRKLPDEGPAILLAHEPDFADIAAPYKRFDLQLSGHTHGGQIRLPLIGNLYGPVHGLRYDAGWFDVDSLKLYVNVGLGVVTIPVRFMCPPEIAIFTLRAP